MWCLQFRTLGRGGATNIPDFGRSYAAIGRPREEANNLHVRLTDHTKYLYESAFQRACETART
ncbi:hypothetical protein GCM10008941_13870 [Rhizomicrobium palustre]